MDTTWQRSAVNSRLRHYGGWWWAVSATDTLATAGPAEALTKVIVQRGAAPARVSSRGAVPTLRPTVWLTGWLADCLGDWINGCLVNWLPGWRTDWLNERLTDLAAPCQLVLSGRKLITLLQTVSIPAPWLGRSGQETVSLAGKLPAD